MRKHLTPGVALGVIAIVFAMTGSAVAGSLITSAKIKDGTIQNKDIKKGTISLNRLTKGTQRAVQRLALAGPAGPAGVERRRRGSRRSGRRRPSGRDAAARSGTVGAGQLGPDEPQHDRLRQRTPARGPAEAAVRHRLAQPHRRRRATDKVGLRRRGRLGRRRPARTTSSRSASACSRPARTASPATRRTCRASSSRSTRTSDDVHRGELRVARLHRAGQHRRRNQWSGYIDATRTGTWGLRRRHIQQHATASLNTARAARWTSSRPTSTRRRPGHDPQRRSVSKGRDYAWSGAVDGLRVNDTVFDFERDGVFPPRRSSELPGAVGHAAPGTLFRGNVKQGGWEDRPAEIAPRTGADPSNLWGNARGGSGWGPRSRLL